MNEHIIRELCPITTVGGQNHETNQVRDEHVSIIDGLVGARNDNPRSRSQRLPEEAEGEVEGK